MADYHLYLHRNSYAMTTHLLLEELGLEYQTSWFNVHKPEEFPAEFVELNPNARVPLLVTPEGPIYESAATMMYLAEQHRHRFLPEPGASGRARALQWLFYLMSTLQPEVLIQFHPERYFPGDAELQKAILAASQRELEPIWRVIDQALQPGPYFLGADYSICDMLFLMQAVWTENQPADLQAHGNTLSMMRASFQRPAVQRIMKIHRIEHLTRI